MKKLEWARARNKTRRQRSGRYRKIIVTSQNWLHHISGSTPPILTEPNASELPKSLVLGRYENIHIRHRRSTPLGDVGTKNCHIPTQDPPYPELDSTIARYCQLWALTTPSRFFFWELTRAELPSGSPILGMLWPLSRLTSKFLRNPNQVTHPGNALAHFSLNFGVPTEPEAILSTLGPNHVLTVLFLGTHASKTSQWVTHPGNALTPFLLNFGVPTEPKASELPKGLVLGRDENIHIRHRGSIPLGDVGSNNCHIPIRARLCRSMILSALGPDHTLTVLFLETHVSRTSKWVTHPGNALASFLT
ncbi:hypothetical protein DVH24_039821 [Malus domestica]|uniref:Uncharacterized protein n=1 Tax=Malus domestica TaxID=3750 RepID=A0A498I3T7_MALDO|nr:hypothetical protein DVH24_039821 [Malus domestica]